MNDRGLQKLSVFLIGMMGAGKTSVGQVLAERLGYRFFDTDVLIERVAGQSIPQIFADRGEQGFRRLESQVLSELSAYTQCAIATGGGIVTQPMNWSYLRHGLIVWLDAPVEVLVQRLESDTTRPLLKEGDPAEKLRSLLATRMTLYRQADLQISAEGTPEAVCDRIIAQIPTVLKPPLTPQAIAEN